MSLADLGCIVAAVVILGVIGFFLYTKSLIKLIDTVDLEGGPGTSFCSL